MLDRNCLRMARLRLRLSQGQLGKALGQDQSYVSKLERGEITEITITTLARLADALGVSTDVLLGRKTVPLEERICFMSTSGTLARTC